MIYIENIALKAEKSEIYLGNGGISSPTSYFLIIRYSWACRGFVLLEALEWVNWFNHCHLLEFVGNTAQAKLRQKNCAVPETEAMTV